MTWLHDLFAELMQSHFNFRILFVVLALIFFFAPFVVQRRLKKTFIDCFLMWTGFMVLGVAMSYFSASFGVVAKVYVLAGDADATVRFGGEEYRFKAGENAWIAADGWRGNLSNQRATFVSTSNDGHSIHRELGPNTYVAELSGKKAYYWSEVMYNGTYDKRGDYRPRGSVCGDVAFLTASASDVIVALDQSPPLKLKASAPALHTRVLQISTSEQPEPEREKHLEDVVGRRLTEDEIRTLLNSSGR